MEYEIITIDMSDRESVNRLKPYLLWWVERTNNEKHMLPTTEESLLNELQAAAIVLTDDGNIIGAAGLVDARGKEKSVIYHEGQKVVELGSNIIHPDFRNKGLGTALVKKRLELSKSKEWFPVSVSSNPIMHKIFEKINAIPMDDKPNLATLRHQLCLCHTVTSDCNLCPLKQRGGWIFP